MEDKLIKRVARGDRHAFNEFYQLTHKGVYRYLYRMLRCEQMAEDVLIETYAEVWRSAGRFRGASRALTWVIGIARNLAMNLFRKKRVNELDIDSLHDQPAVQTHRAEDTERAELIARAIDLISPDHREVLDLVFFQGITYKEISQLIGIPVNTVKTRVFYAKEELRDALKDMGVKKDDLL